VGGDAAHTPLLREMDVCQALSTQHICLSLRTSWPPTFSAALTNNCGISPNRLIDTTNSSMKTTWRCARIAPGGPCQIEKDERFWTAAALIRLIKAPNRVDVLASLLAQAFDSRRPSLAIFDDWHSCLTGNLQLALEASLPSPPSYCSWLRGNGSGQHFIPYVERARERNTEGNLEGATSVDAVIVNLDNGFFALMIEAKVLSDVSKDVSFDTFRHQIARNMDVMLEGGREPKWLAARKASGSHAIRRPMCLW
jgi:hypothetical protein